MTRIAVLSDLHGHFPEVPECDVLLLAGDYALASVDRDTGQLDMRLQKKQHYDLGMWLSRLVERGTIPIGVAGNHDFLLEANKYATELPWVYLEDSMTVVNGLKVWGSPWQPWLGGWAFNAPEDDPTENFLADKFSLIPDDTDIILAHTPPAGFKDKYRGAHKGSIALNEACERVAPKLLVCGHIHNPGIEQIENTVLVNASYVGWDRKPNNHPIQTFEI